MTDRAPQIGRLSIPGKKQAELSEVITQIAVDYSSDKVCELSLTILDPEMKLTVSPLAAIGSIVGFAGENWEVASIEAELTEWGSTLMMRCRDPLAKALKATYKTSGEKKVAPGSWITNRVATAGGSAHVQPSTTRATISQSKNQSSLDVVNNLSNQLDWSWTSYGGNFYAGTRYYAWDDNFALPRWAVTWRSSPSTDAVSAEWNESSDNTNNFADMDLTVTYDYGVHMRPWHLLNSTIPGATGTWLIDSVSIDHDAASPIKIHASRPKQPAPKAGSSSTETS